MRYLLLLILFFSSSIHSKEVVKIGYNLVPPYSVDDGQSAGGPVNEYVMKVFKEMDVEVKFLKMPLARLIHSLQNNDLDMISFYTLGSEIKGGVDAEEAFSKFFPGVLVRRDVKLKSISSARDLLGLKIGTKKGMPMIESMSDKRLNISYIEASNSLERALRMTLFGRFDMVWSNAVHELIYMSQKDNDFEKFKVIFLPEDPLPLGSVFSSHGASKFKSRYDEINRRLIKENTYQKIFNKSVKNPERYTTPKLN